MDLWISMDLGNGSFRHRNVEYQKHNQYGTIRVKFASSSDTITWQTVVRVVL